MRTSSIFSKRSMPTIKSPDRKQRNLPSAALSNSTQSSLTTPKRTTPDRSQVTKSTPTSIYNSAHNPTRGNNISKGTYNTKRRVCFCDRYECPTECDQCNHDTYSPCNNHVLVPCSTASCSKLFHKECLNSIHQSNPSSVYTCIECESVNQLDDILWNDASDEMKARRMGIVTPFNVCYDPNIDGVIYECNQNAIRRDTTKLYQSLLDSDLPTETLNSILYYDPKPYPSVSPIHSRMLHRHAIAGRRFEISMLLFKVLKCSCCGVVMPSHSDPLFPTKNIPFERTHFYKNFHPAYKCTCSGVCKGEQFYSFNRPTHKEWFLQHHDNQVFPDTPNVLLCTSCHTECVGQNVPSLQSGRKFSLRNGFGCVLPRPIKEDPNYAKSRELHELLSKFTMVEEAAIRSIVPLLSIVRLMHGSIGTKGNTSCVWQQSTLATVLPNLPSECKFIIINRKTKQNKPGKSQITSTKFERINIQRAIELLMDTVPGVWKNDNIGYPSFSISMSQEKLQAWPESGDITELKDVPTVYEKNDDGKDLIIESAKNAHTKPSTNDILQRDGDDLGPAPLQNSVALLETFEAVVDMGNKTSAASANAMLGFKKLQERMDQLRNINIDEKKETATMQQDDVMKNGDFVNMDITPFSWSRAFPTLFIPTYFNSKWVIQHDISGCMNICDAREKEVKFKEWLQFMMFRSDGAPASHPTFALVAMNHKMKQQLQGQGQFALHTSDMNPNMTGEELLKIWDDKEGERKNLFTRLHQYSSNIVGTDPYWKSTRFSYKATTFFKSYIHKQELSLFHTGSIAEFHEPWLRFLLSKYISMIEHPNISKDHPTEILTDDKVLMKYVQCYKNIVTMYFAVKMEIWMALFMKPVHGVEGGLLSYEFAASRGAIHYHCILYTRNPPLEQYHGHSADDVISSALNTYAQLVSTATSTLFHRCETEAGMSFSSKLTSKDKLKYCIETSMTNPIVQDIVEEFHSVSASAKSTCDKEVTNVMEQEWGYDAIHVGNFPSDWVRPGGAPTMQCYRRTSDAMMTSNEVIEKKELKQLKSSQESKLFCRKVNICNHCRTHKCSKYCGRTETITFDFKPGFKCKEDDKRIYVDDNGKRKIKLEVYICRQNFGQFLEFDPSGESNLTRGKEPVIYSHIEFDPNGQPKYIGKRNHPRVLQEPHSFEYFGANNDIQRFLICHTPEEMDESQTTVLLSNLAANGMIGLEKYSGAFICVDYTTKYATKGGLNSDGWNKSSKALTNEYVNRDPKKPTTIKGVVAKVMYSISSQMSMTLDQAQYQACGGKLVRMSYGSTLKCSVNQVLLDDLGKKEDIEEDTDEVDAKNLSFTWDNVTKKYKAFRCNDKNNTNLYCFVVRHWKKNKESIPQFFGYNNNPSWPLSEEYSKWMLTFYKPWNNDVTELKLNGSYKISLEAFLSDPMFPRSIYFEIMRLKLKCFKSQKLDPNAGSEFIGTENYTSPTNDQ